MHSTGRGRMLKLDYKARSECAQRKAGIGGRVSELIALFNKRNLIPGALGLRNSKVKAEIASKAEGK